MSYYAGLFALSQPVTLPLTTKSAAGVLKFADSNPTYRIYGPGVGGTQAVGIMTNSTGSLQPLDPSVAGGVITGATNASPIVITSNGHGLSTGARVTIQSVQGNSAANGDWEITALSTNTFSLFGSTGSGVYTSGGTWWTTGLYGLNFTPQPANGFAAGQNYVALVNWQMAGVPQADLITFSLN